MTPLNILSTIGKFIPDMNFVFRPYVNLVVFQACVHGNNTCKAQNGDVTRWKR